MIKMIKQKFILELLQGKEISIPRQLMQQDLPTSFKYYDPIILFLNDFIEEQQKVAFTTQRRIYYDNLLEKDITHSVKHLAEPAKDKMHFQMTNLN